MKAISPTQFNTLTRQIVMACAAIGLATYAFLAHADGSATCQNAADKQACWHQQMEQHMADHETRVHDALHLSAAQEPAWKAYTDTMHQQMAAMQADHAAHPSKAEFEKMSAPERMQLHLTIEQKHLAMEQTHIDALKTLYTALSPTQQTIMNLELEKTHRHTEHHHSGGDHASEGAPAHAPT